MGRTIVLPEADRLVRRASIASRSRRDIHRELMKLVPALYSLNAWLDTVLRGWTHWTSGKRHALEQDWLTFSATIKESYAQEGGRAAHRQESAAKAGRSAGWNDPARDGYPNPEYGSR